MDHEPDRPTHDRVERWMDFPGVQPEEIWAVVGKFAMIDEWHPGLEASEAVSLDGEPHRHVTVKGGGGMILEKLTHNEDMTQRYEIIESPLPVEDYKATIHVFAQDGGTRVFWSSTFTPTAPGAEKVVAGIYETGFRGLRERFGA